MKRVAVSLMALLCAFGGSLQSNAESKPASVGSAAASPSPTPPGSFTPVAATPDVDLLYYYFVAGDYGGVRIKGLLKNHTDHVADAPTVGFAFYDRDGNVLGTGFALPLLEGITPGKTVPVDGYIENNGPEFGEWNRVSVSFCRWDQNNPNINPAGLSLREVKETGKKANALQIKGVVKNTTDTAMDDVAVVAVLSDANGRYASHITDYLNLPIPPGKTERFLIDEGFTQFSSDEPVKAAGPGYTYRLIVGRGINVGLGCTPTA